MKYALKYHKFNHFCCVPQCKSRCKSEVQLLKFPREKKLKKKWAKVLKIGKKVTDCTYICRSHFLATDFHAPEIKRKKWFLKKGVIPSRNIPQGLYIIKKISPRNIKLLENKAKEMLRNSDSKTCGRHSTCARAGQSPRCRLERRTRHLIDLLASKMASKSNGVDSGDWSRAPPAPSGPLWQRAAKILYNPEEHSVLGRTPKRWAIVLTFYAIFYAVLAALFSACFAGLMYKIDNKTPMWTLKESLIGANPGVAFRPLPLYGFNIRYASDNESHYQAYTDSLDDFFKEYEGDSWYSAHKGCDAADGYGFPKTPCFFIKLNKIYNWAPEYYNDVGSLPAEMDSDLTQYIQSAVSKDQIWISCWDEKGNATKLEYPWGRGLPGSFYPYVNAEGYRSPLVALRIDGPVNTDITIRCRAWAKNIVYNKSLKEGTGYTRILLYIEDRYSVTTSAQNQTTK